ncbi:hypothetical protein ACRS8P_19805 [Burkholderia cenocepacia]|uniref:hypothetical protein n=1 Tax=Burkholderia TaxID=32008 RepID=UPI0010413DE9|nr:MULTISPECIES: hypothetical protein [Burkholderia]
MAFDRKSAEEEFDNFLMNMDDQLDWLSRKAEEHGIELDVGLDDLSKLEKLFDLLSDGKDKDYVSKLVVTFARFLGEIVRENYGGKWTLPLDDEKNINFNTPVIVGHVPIEGLEFAPLSVMRAYALRRKQGTLRRAVDAQVNPKPVDLSGLEEE